MSFILRTVRPDALQNWVKTNAAGSLKRTARESWIAYLQANGGVGNTIVDQEYSFLKNAGITVASGKTLADLWTAYANASSGNKNREKLRNLYM